MVIVQITFQQGSERQKHPQKHNVQHMIKILCNVEPAMFNFGQARGSASLH